MNSLKKTYSSYISTTFIIVLGLLMIYPVVWMIFGSFKDNSQILNESSKLLPSNWVMSNYEIGWKGYGRYTFGTFFINSFWVAGISTIGMTISSAFVAYAFSRIQFRGRKLWFICMISTLMLPGQVVLIPQYIIFQKLKLVNSYTPLILPMFFGSAFFIYLMMQFMYGLPKELDESAFIEGCSRYSIFFRIIFPLISPALITTFIIQFYWKWDDFLGPLIYLSRPQKYTVSLAIKMFADASSTTDYGAMFAMSTLSLLPVFLIFLFFNRYLMEGISTSGLKG